MTQKITSLILTILLPIGVFANLSILLVNDNNNDAERITIIEEAITSNAYEYVLFDASAAGASPSQALMESFDLVIWYTGNDSNNLLFWNGNDTDNEAIEGYLANGGMLWVQGLDWLFDRYGGGPAVFNPGNLLNDYFGIYTYYGQSYVNDGGNGVPQLDSQSGNSIFSLNTIEWQYSTMWYVDALIGTSSSQYLYEMGPSSYLLSGFYPAIYMENQEAKVISFAFETARLDSQSHTNSLLGDGLDFFASYGSGITIPLSQVSVFSESGETSIDENEGTLQLSTELLPANASVPFVYWEIVDGSATANISQEGLLQANGLNNGNLWVKVTALDGTNLADSIEINISEQGEEEYTILFVNDNANTPDRYLSIDSTLSNMPINYAVYDAVEQGEYPSLVTLNGYDLVIWYTGNDGANLYLWNIDDPDHPIFNDPLIQYLDNGGDLWLQGLDFLYDVYGSAPDTFSAGDFVYDYLGIESYIAQSKSDDGGLGVPQMDVVSNPICFFSPVQWIWETLWYADGLLLRAEAEPIYKMGPEDYVLSSYYSGVFYEKEDAKILTFTFETGQLNLAQNRDAFYYDVLNYFDISIGINDKEPVQEDFYLFPNPASQQFTVKTKETENSLMKIYSLTGELLYEEEIIGQKLINTASLKLSKGLYFIQMNWENRSQTEKLIIR